MRALVTGATGFIGRELLKRLDRPVVLSRNPQQAKRLLGVADALGWDPTAGPAPAEAFAGIDVVIHLAGDPVADGRWNQEKKRRIRDSRVLGTRHLVDGIAASAHKPPVLISGSAVGYYGARGDELLTEESSLGSDFLAEVCVAWEQESRRAESFGVRVVNPRTGIVLGPGGGALQKMLLPFKLGLGGRLGDGRQWMPWIHLDDMVGLILHAAENSSVHGAMNAVAPGVVTNREFTATLASSLHRPAIFPVPKLALWLAVGEFAEILLASQRVVPRVAEETGYRFQYSTVRLALNAIIKSLRTATA